MAIGIARRQFISALGGAAAWPIAARAQQPTLPVIGFLHPGSAKANMFVAEAFRSGLAEHGYVEGRNLAIEYRWGDGQYDRLPAMAADLVRSRVVVIAALGSSAPARAAKAATTTIPIVFQTGADPVEDGLVASMNRPGGNITGASRMNIATDAKRLEILHETVPNAAVIACLINLTSPRSGSQVQQLLNSTRSLGLKLQIVSASTEQDLENAFARMAQAGAAALFVTADPSMNAMREQIASRAVGHALPTMSDTREWVTAGALLSYDASLADSNRQAGVYVGRILKGEKPADLPVLQPTKFELVINLKTAKALGIAIPPKILALADEVIE